MYKAFQASNHCLHLPFLPTQHTFHAVASHSLLVPRNFMPFTAPTAANISSFLVISAAKTYRTFRLYKYTSRWAFCLQVSSTSDEQQSENPTHLPVAASNCLSSAIFRPLFAGHLASLAGSYFPDTCYHTFQSLRWPQSTRLKQSLVPRLSFYFAPLIDTAQSSGFTSQPFKDVLQSRPPLVSRHPITFATPQQHTCMVSQVTATAPFFGSPAASFHTCQATATVKHEKPSQSNPSGHPAKLLNPPHFLLATGVRYLCAHLLPVGHKRKPQACGIGQWYHLSNFILIIPSLLP